MKINGQPIVKMPGESQQGPGGPFQSYSSVPLKRKNSLGSTTSDVTEITQKSTATNNLSSKSHESNGGGKNPSPFANTTSGETFFSKNREFSKDENFFPPNNFLNEHNQTSNMFAQSSSNGYFAKMGGTMTAGGSSNTFRSSREDMFKENIFVKSGLILFFSKETMSSLSSAFLWIN
jgi:hypothetical protein